MNIALADAASINANWLAPKETLPGWTYSSAEFFALEKEHLILSTWQIVCHVSELPNPVRNAEPARGAGRCRARRG
jgi:hypothetical protein